MLRSTLKQYVQVEDQRPILWLSKLRYIPYFKLSEGFDDERAKLKWEEDVANPDVERQGVGDSLELVVRGIPTPLWIRGRELARAHETRSMLDSTASTYASLRKLTTLGSGPAAKQGDFAGLGAVFRIGASSSASPMEASVRLNNPPVLQPPSMLAVVPSDRFELPSDSHAKKRPLAAQLSDPDPEQGQPNTTRQSSTTVIGQVLLNRKEAIYVTKQAHTDYGAAQELGTTCQ
jgi:hypothetical protein